MPSFQAKVLGRNGTQVINVEAKDLKQAQNRASAQGKVLSIKKKRRFSGRGMSYGDRQIFLSKLSAMLASSVGASDALRLLRGNFGGPVRRVAVQLENLVESGETLPDAFAMLEHKFIPEATAAMIQAGSHSGATHEALKGAMDFERTMERVRKESGKGLMNAVMGFLIAAGFILGTVFGFLPKVMNSDLMKMGGGANDHMMDWTIQAADVVGYIMLAIGVVFIALVVMGTVGRKVAPVAVDRLILKIPFYKDMILAKNNFVAFYGLSLLVKTGVSMEGSLGLMAQTTKPGALRDDFLKSADAVRKGRPWHQQMRSLEDTDRAALGASLDRSQVSQAMEAISIQYQDIYAQRMASFVPVMQGISALFLMLSGLIMFGVTILPMLKMSTSILGN